MAGLGNRRGSKTSSGSGSARDRISAAREKMNGSSRGSSKGISGGAKSRPKIGGGSKGGYILTESADNLIGGKLTKKSGPRLSTREEVLEARKKRQEQKSGAGPRRVTREELLEKRKGVERQKDKTKIGAKRVTREDLVAARNKRAEQEAKSGMRLRPGGTREGVAPKRGGVVDTTPADRGRGPRPGGNVGPEGRGPKAGRGQGGKSRGPGPGVGQGRKGGAGPKRGNRGARPGIGADRGMTTIAPEMFFM